MIGDSMYNQKFDFTKKGGSGFTLIELVVAMSLFIILVSISSAVFVQSLRTQRNVVRLTSALSNITQAIEQMAREIRTGEKFQESTPDALDPTHRLNFINYRSERVSYKLLDDRTIGKCVADPSSGGFCLPGDEYASITSAEFPLNWLRFEYIGEEEFDGSPPRITISVSLEGLSDSDINMQTTVSSKNIGN